MWPRLRRDATVPFELPKKVTDAYYLSIQGFHILEKSNVDGAKKYVTFFMKHPDVISWYHAVPLHIIPASRTMLHSAKYQDNPVIQKRMDVLKFLDSIWTKGVPLADIDPPAGADLGDVVKAIKNLYSMLRQMEQASRSRPLHGLVVATREMVERDLIRRV